MRAKLSPVDQIISSVDAALRTVLAGSSAHRPSPANTVSSETQTPAERELVGRLMRVNHAGEIAAQALYQGQAMTAKTPALKRKLLSAAAEENDHLDWCESRLKELDDKPSRLAPFWYAGSFALGAFAGLLGDRWSLGFLAETEKQVEAHLEEHLEQLPQGDKKSRAVLEQMKQDEIRHGRNAIEAGGRELPEPVRDLMKLASRVMTRTAYWF